MNVRTLILAILHFTEASGYDIKKMSSDGPFSFFIDISFGSIYPTLARLEQEGLVACRVENHPGKPAAKVYTITDKGESELVIGLRQAPQKDIFKSEFLLQAMNAELIGAQALGDALGKRIAHMEANLEMLEGIVADCDHPATCWVINYAKHVMSSDIAYLRKNRGELIAIASEAAREPQAAE